METVENIESICERCGAVIAADSMFCQRCVAAPQPDRSSVASGPGAGGTVGDFVHNPWAVLGLLFFVTMFLGLPVLWISRGFSRPAKWVLTVVVLLYSALIFWLFWLVMMWSYSRVMESMQ